MKERIVIPERLQGRVERLVRDHAKAQRTSEQDARRVVEMAILQQGVEALERRAAEEGS
jgi:hypothetical protein